VLLVLPDPMKAVRAQRAASSGVPESELLEGEEFVAREAHGLFRTIWAYKGVLVKLGSGAALVAAMRAGRSVLLPLWAVSIGITEANTALIIGIAGGVDFALFYSSGQIMDRFGRMWSALPSMIGLGTGYLVLSFTHGASANVQWFVAVAVFLAVANGIGSGLLMTLGADLAPQGNPAPFLGAWRFTGDGGSAAAPLLISLLTAVASLALASGVMGVLGLVGAGILARYVPRYVPRRPRTT
jgi:MFS family permease